jgi:hypothetical protein
MTDTVVKTEGPVETPEKTVSKKVRSFSEQISRATVMASAARTEFMDLLTRRGVGEEGIAKLEELTRIAKDNNNRQEFLKGELKKLSVMVTSSMRDLGKKYSEIKRIIKLDVPQAEWKKFAIDDKK